MLLNTLTESAPNTGAGRWLQSRGAWKLKLLLRSPLLRTLQVTKSPRKPSPVWGAPASCFQWEVEQLHFKPVVRLKEVDLTTWKHSRAPLLCLFERSWIKQTTEETHFALTLNRWALVSLLCVCLCFHVEVVLRMFDIICWNKDVRAPLKLVVASVVFVLPTFDSNSACCD